MRRGRRTLVVAGLLALLLVAMVVATAVGAVAVPVGDQLRILWQRVAGGPLALLGAASPDEAAAMATIVTQFRVPRVVTAALVGMILAVSGTTMQGVFRNPLADPYLLGIAGGATAGVAAAIYLGWSAVPLVIPLAAFVGGLCAVAIVFGLAGRARDGVALILAGVALAALFAAVTALFLFLAGERQRTGIVFWVMGGLAGGNWWSVQVLLPGAVVGSVVTWILGRELNALALGDEQATHLGVNPVLIKRVLLLVATLMTSVAVAMSGTIGFVGLVIPHVMRLLIGPEHRWLVVTSAVGGAAFLVLSDLAARSVVAPAEMPVGIVTAVVGGPFFLYLLRVRLVRPTSSG